VSEPPDIGSHELPNLHDLGGLATPDGPLRHGRLFRSANPDGLTPDGWQQLVDAGIRTIVDLRNDDELVGSVRPETLTVARRPMEDQSDENFMAEWGDRLGSPEYYPEVTRLWPHLLADAVGAVADAPEGGVLIHCMAGRDRTGMITAILLELVHVDRDAIFDDFAISATAINAWWRIHGGPKGSQTDDELADYLVGAKQTLNAFLDDLDAPTYLADAGVGIQQLARIRLRLLDA
jgi:protein tyrosine/serine phosphatase